MFWVLRAKKIFRKIENTKNLGKPKIVILALRTIPTTSLVYFDAIFGHVFQKAGAEVLMLYCDGAMDSCDANTILRGQASQCYVCQKFNCQMKKTLGLNTISYKDFISEKEIKEIKEEIKKIPDEKLSSYNYFGINVGKHAHSSVVRYFLFGKLDMSDKEHVLMLRNKLKYSMIGAKVASKVFEKEKPDIIFMLHGIYSTWGSFLSYFRSKKVDAIVYENRTPRNGYFSFFRNCEAFKIFAKDEWEKIKKFPLQDMNIMK